jgi:hypothetical protein
LIARAADIRRFESEDLIRQRRDGWHAAIVAAGGDCATFDVATKNVLDVLLYLWRGKEILPDALDLATAAVLLGTVCAVLLPHGGQPEVKQLDELRRVLLARVDQLMYGAPAHPRDLQAFSRRIEETFGPSSTVNAAPLEDSVHGPTGPCTAPPINPNKPDGT